MKAWWLDDRYFLGTLENEDDYVTVLQGRRIEGVWEYAAIRYRNKVPSLLWTLRGGKILRGNE